MKIIIIGSGIAALSAAARLSTRGHEVIVFESANGPGGKLREKWLDGFRFDLGPSLFTMPQWVDHIFEEAQKNPRRYYNYLKLEKTCNYFYEDGTTFSAYADNKVFKDEIHKKLGITLDKLEEYQKITKKMYDITAHIFIEKSLHKLKSYLSWKVVKSLFQIRHIRPYDIMHEMNAKFFKSKHLQQYFNRFATYNGSNPYAAPATLNLISHLEHGFGAFFPKGGMYQITNSVYQLCIEQGVKFNFNTYVDNIEVRKGKVVGISTKGQLTSADVVISNMDVFPTYKLLLKKHPYPKTILNQEKSSSALIFYWGVNIKVDQLDLHNILFSDNYYEEFRYIFKLRSIFYDPTIYINITSKYNEQDAPPGGENWFVMINVPNNDGQDWQTLKEAAKINIINKINRVLKIDITSHIVVEEILDPIQIENKTSSYRGALYGNASNNPMAAFLRHPNFSRKIKNLYFCGGSVHPGGGIPLAVMSGKIVADLIKNK